MQLAYTHEYAIGYDKTDLKGNMRPSCLLGCMQDIAGRHSVLLGNSREDLMEKYGCFWMLVRVQYTLLRPLGGDETLTITTWARSIKGAMTYRDFEFRVGDEYVGYACSAWVVANFETRRLMRLSNVGFTQDVLHPDHRDGEEIGHIQFPEVLPKSHDRIVRMSDLDVNYHLNNTKYADIVLDTLDLRDFDLHFISKFQLNYVQECLADDSITVYAGTDGVCRFACGEKDGKCCFESKMELAPLQTNRKG